MNNNPTVLTTGETVKPNKKWYQTWKIIYPILGLVVIVELILGLKTLLAPLPKAPSTIVKSTGYTSIKLDAPKLIYKVGDTIPVTVRVFTGGHTAAGVDLLLHFNPNFLEATQSAFTAGKIFNDYPIIKVDSKNGTIDVSGVSSLGKNGFRGGGDLGVVRFKAKQKGKTPLTVEFEKGLTTDSNVFDVKTNEDVLEKVINLNITIQ